MSLCQLHFYGTKAPHCVQSHLDELCMLLIRLSVYEPDKQIINSISISSFSNKLVLEFDERQNDDSDLIMSKLIFRVEHHPHLFPEAL